MIDIIHTLGQFTKLCEAVKDLPRLPKDAVVVNEETNDDVVEEDEEQVGGMPRTLSDASVDEGIIITYFSIYLAGG